MPNLIGLLGRALIGEELYLDLRNRRKGQLQLWLRRKSRDLAIPIRMMNASARSLPDYLLIGTQKGGSTSLYQYLIQHPQILPILRKEPGYFSHQIKNGLSWYRAHFPLNNQLGSALTGEASADYIFHPHAANEAFRIVPQAKIVALLRNPINRAYSHYHHNAHKGRESRSFEEAVQRDLEILDNTDLPIYGREFIIAARYLYLRRGCYAEQIARWLACYPKEQVLVLPSEELFKNPRGILTRVLQFLELPTDALDQIKITHQRPGQYSDPISPGTRARLREYFRPYNEQLFELLGESCDWD